MSARRAVRSSENRKISNDLRKGTKQLPTILGRKRKSEDDDPSQTDIQSYFNVVNIKSKKSENFQGLSLSSNMSNRPTSSRVPLATLSLSSDNIVKDDQPGSSSSSLKRQNLCQTPRRKQAWKKPKMRDSWSQFRAFISEPVLPGLRGETPLPELSWADRQEMWDLMVKKESGMYTRANAETMLCNHPSLQPKMRAILLDWLIEVCEVYRLHRETFYLAVDFLDRFLGVSTNVPKNRLQLIGTTCLFIGAKLEEIYPPKLQEFAFVTDGACTEEEITQMELVILKDLNWGLSPMTPNAWMRMYMQTLHGPRTPNCHAFSLPAYNGLPFSTVMQLLDLCMLDVGSLDFSYSVLATSALYHMENETVALGVSGYTWPDIARCVRWMSAFALAIRERSPLQPKSFHGVAPDDAHHVQTHSVDLTLLERALSRLHALATGSLRDSPDPNSQPGIPSGLENTPQEEVGDIMYPPTTATTSYPPGFNPHTPATSTTSTRYPPGFEPQTPEVNSGDNLLLSPPLDGDLW